MLIIYTIDNKLHIQSSHIIKKGRVKIFDGTGKTVETGRLKNGLFYSKRLNLKSGRYLVKVEWDGGHEHKHIYIKQPTNKSESTTDTM